MIFSISIVQYYLRRETLKRITIKEKISQSRNTFAPSMLYFSFLRWHNFRVTSVHLNLFKRLRHDRTNALFFSSRNCNFTYQFAFEMLLMLPYALNSLTFPLLFIEVFFVARALPLMRFNVQNGRTFWFFEPQSEKTIFLLSNRELQGKSNLLKDELGSSQGRTFLFSFYTANLI